MNSLEEVKEIIKSDKRKLTIVFDIDDTLAAHSSINDEEKLYVLRKSMIIFAAEREHQVLPGVIELMQMLFSKDYINLVFFSSGIKERNTEFVKELLIRSLGQDKYQEVEPLITILSKDNLTPGEENQANQMYLNFGLNWGNNKKDITKGLAKDGSLANAIFIDDDSTYIYCGQEKNFLRSPPGRAEYYGALKKMTPDIAFYEYKNDELFFEFNTVFYIAGVLSHCIDEFEKGHDAAGLLFDMHFKKSTDKLFGFEPRYDCVKNKEYYAKGLRSLRTVKPDICFVSHEDYVGTLDSPATEQEQQTIDDSKSRKTNREDCCVR